MMLVICLLLLGAEILHFLELRECLHRMEQKRETSPPKARSSFVVKRMEERLKEAMYPKESGNR